MIETSSGLPWKSLAILGSFEKCSGTFVWPSDQFWIFGNFRKVDGNLRKIVKNALTQYVYIIKRTFYVSSKIWTLCSSGKNNIPRVSAAANEWDIGLSLEHKTHIFSSPCNILYVLCHIFFWLNNLKGTAKAPTEDLLRLNMKRNPKTMFLTPKEYDKHPTNFCKGVPPRRCFSLYFTSPNLPRFSASRNLLTASLRYKFKL